MVNEFKHICLVWVGEKVIFLGVLLQVLTLKVHLEILGLVGLVIIIIIQVLW